MKQLHHNAVILFYVNGLIVSILLLGSLLFFPLWILLLGLAVEGTLSFVWSILFSIITLVIIFLIPLPWAQLAYKNYRYELAQDRINIKKGVIWKKHVSIPYERIQNVNIVQGPIARMLGLAELQIQTAGISGVAMVEGRIPAVSPEEATRLKDQILSKISGAKNQGL